MKKIFSFATIYKLMWVLGVSAMVLSSAMLNVDINIKDRPFAWFLENLLSILGLITITFGTIWENVKKFKETSQDYITYSCGVKDAAKLYRPSIWALFIAPINRRRKIKSYEAILIHKEKTLDDLATEEDINIYLNGTPEEKESNPYCKQKANLRVQMQKEWLDSNIDLVTVNYDKISYDVVFSGYSTKEHINEVNDFITKNKTKKIAVENMPRISISAGVMMLLSSILLKLDFSVSFYTLAGIKLITVAWSTWLAKRYSDKYTEEVELKDILFQYGYAKEYLTFIKTHQKEEN
jgi:hypothetical protein